MPLGIIAEGMARIEHKLDLIITALMGMQIFPPMHFIGNQCPVCKQIVDYQINITKNVVTRRCGCSTGKLPMTIPLTPVEQNGELNGNTASNKSSPSTGNAGDPSYRNRR